MFADRDYERTQSTGSMKCDTPDVTVENWIERRYSVVYVQCEDRPKLLFDVVCTLTDMEYVVFHATIDAQGSRAYMEFYIKHNDGTPISSDAERQRVVQCLQASIQRRASQGVRLELYAKDRRHLLADVTRTFRENGLNVTRAEISTTEDMALNIFYVTDAEGYPVDRKTIEAVQEKIGPDCLKVKELPLIDHHKKTEERNEAGVGVGGAMLLSLGSLVMKNLYNLGLVRSHS